MKTASPELIAFLNASNQYIMVDLYTVTLESGDVYRWSSANVALVVGGDTFDAPPLAPLIKRGGFKSAIGLEVSTLSLNMEAGDGDFQIDGLHLSAAAENGLLDGAGVLLERLFMPTYGDTSLGTVTLFYGEIANITTTSTGVQCVVKSAMEKLIRQMPRNLFMPACAHVLYDAGCGLNRATFTVSGEVVAGLTPTANTFRTDLTAADDYYNLGTLTITSGPMTGVARPVKSYLNTNGLTVLGVVLPQAPTIGTTFDVTPGCDKTQATCASKFGNLDHFRGFPFVPAPEAAR